MSDIKQVIVMRKDLNMRKGKMIAQGAHASMAFITNKLIRGIDDKYGSDPFGLFTLQEVLWMKGNFKKICVGVDSVEELEQISWAAAEAGIHCENILDDGLTEFNGTQTWTCLALGPDYSEKIDAITGSLKLL